MTVTVLHISTWTIVIDQGIIFLLSVYTNILCYSLIIYICSMYVVYFMHNVISISSFLSFPRSIICNPVCYDKKWFILFLLLSGLVGIVVFLLLACSPSLLRALIIFIILRPLFRIKQIGLGTFLRSFFCGLIWIFQINWRSYHGLIQNLWINWRSYHGPITIYLFMVQYRITYYLTTSTRILI